MKKADDKMRENKRIKYVRRTRGLISEYSCNLDCTYCYIREKSEKKMPIAVAKEAIADGFMDDKRYEFEEVEIDFVGAEPLTYFEGIKEIAEWMWSREWPKPYILFATTNGTLLNDEMKVWLERNKERFVLGVSYDGTTDTQDKNRSDSSLRIDLDFFVNTWPKQPIKMTIAEETVSDLCEGIKYLHEKGFEINANVAYGTRDWKEESVVEYSKQLMKLVDYYEANPSQSRASLFNLDLTNIVANKTKNESKYCGAGVAYDVVDIDGKVYPCHMFSPLVLDEEKLKKLEKIDFNQAEAFENERCKACIFKKVCPTCYGMNYYTNSDVSLREGYICKLFIVQVLANCKLQARLLAKKEKLEKKDYMTARAIVYIQKYIQKIKKV